MLRQEDERAIEDLFERLRNVERNSAARDADAEQLIRQRLAENPSSAYFMAQTIIVQEAALREAQQKIEQLEARQSQGGFLGGIFGGDRPAAEHRGNNPSPWGRPQDSRDDLNRSRGSGGFLAGAAQTALGVTGGLLLGGMLTGLFNNEAQADDTNHEDTPDDPGFDQGGDAGDDFDVGGEF